MDDFRRRFLAHGMRLAGLAALAQAYPGALQARTQDYPFRLGVASGSPRSDCVVLWTRLCSTPLSPEPFAAGPVKVRWEIAHDEAFRSIAAQGEASALPELAHSVHVDAAGLAPARWYWYRFMVGDAVSPVGRTRTAPAADAPPANLRLAFASCQHWEFGHFSAYRHMLATQPELILFIGDYIYEWGAFDDYHPAKPRARKDARNRETVDLESYRQRYAQYKTDPWLQAAHHAAPWILTWDDHEVQNDYANDRGDHLGQDFIARRAAAYQAYYEHMPIRMPALGDGPQRFANFRLYDRYDWGRTARFNVLDDRQYRALQACTPAGRGGSATVDMSCKERLDPARSLLGREQEAWLAQGLANSPARWNIIAQQTIMAQNSRVPIKNPEVEGRFWNDAWDGYPAARDRLMDDLAKYKPANPVVIGGDVHSFFAADLRRDFNAPVSSANPVLAAELVGTSVTSNSRAQSVTDTWVSANPHMHYGRSDTRGFVTMDISPKQTLAHYIGLDDVFDADTKARTMVSWQIEDGRPGLQKA